MTSRLLSNRTLSARSMSSSRKIILDEYSSDENKNKNNQPRRRIKSRRDTSVNSGWLFIIQYVFRLTFGSQCRIKPFRSWEKGVSYLNTLLRTRPESLHRFSRSDSNLRASFLTDSFRFRRIYSTPERLLLPASPSFRYDRFAPARGTFGINSFGHSHCYSSNHLIPFFCLSKSVSALNSDQSPLLPSPYLFRINVSSMLVWLLSILCPASSSYPFSNPIMIFNCSQQPKSDLGFPICRSDKLQPTHQHRWYLKQAFGSAHEFLADKLFEAVVQLPTILEARSLDCNE